MKILYAVQGTGNGHLSRAQDIIPALQNRAQVDILVSGSQAEVKLPFNVKYKLKGLGFYFGKKGGIDFLKTFSNNSLISVFKEIKNCPVEAYDLVINDFEPISAWACFFKGVKSISLSHQGVLYTPNVPKPLHRDIIGKLVLKYYAKCNRNYGFHFKKYNDKIHTPVIRKTIRKLKPKEKGHYTVYLPAYSDENIIAVLSKIKDVKWKVFSKQARNYYQKKNVYIRPISGEKFERSLADCNGIICGAGFETPAEAIYLKKKVLVIPMKNQYEQYFNAKALEELGAPVLKSLKKKYVPQIKMWIESYEKIILYFPDETQDIIDNLLADYIQEEALQWA